jgi:hypothetical protein
MWFLRAMKEWRIKRVMYQVLLHQRGISEVDDRFACTALDPVEAGRQGSLIVGGDQNKGAMVEAATPMWWVL